MEQIKKLEPVKVFEYFCEISRIPRGSGNMDGISAYCEEFAKARGLRYHRDSANNVVIYKNGTAGYEDSLPVILQGHLDMVCQKDDGVEIDFEKDGLELYVDGDWLKAKGTTLGADNGIAVAMTLAILDSDDVQHPPIEAVFTTDEEIGMDGAKALDMSLLRGRRMLNLDAEDPTTLTVSCAGGSDFFVKMPYTRKKVSGKKVTVSIRGLEGGHSGVEIHRGHVNASILLGRVLAVLNDTLSYELLSVSGGEKGNAIPTSSVLELVVDKSVSTDYFSDLLEEIKSEISDREPGFSYFVDEGEVDEYDCMSEEAKDFTMRVLVSVPNGVMDMSVSIDGLVETSLNLGILKTTEQNITMLFTLRSNKQSALRYLEKRLYVFFSAYPCTIEVGGHYPPWEYCAESKLQPLYVETYREMFGTEASVVAIHAGLECGLFAASLEGLDCIALGTLNMDIHTPRERLSISSAENTYELLKTLLRKMK